MFCTGQALMACHMDRSVLGLARERETMLVPPKLVSLGIGAGWVHADVWVLQRELCDDCGTKHEVDFHGAVDEQKNQNKESDVQTRSCISIG